MDTPQSNIFKLTAEREKALWDNAIFVFDSSALLDFYFLPLITRTKIFEELFSKKLNERLWIPSHVKFEYQKNREKIILKPITENYKPLKDEILKSIKSAIKEIENKIIDLTNKTKKDDKHPHLNQIEIEKYALTVTAFKKASETFEEEINKQINLVEEEINKLPLNDDVEKAIDNLFQVGRYFTFQEVYQITKEGKHRYEFTIPPGYEDLKDKDKKGTQIFGDLIIWKQILEFAKEKQKPIIFICNDLKEDWCYLQKNSSEKRIESPREELIKEIFDFASVEFWMYNQPQFLFKSNEYFEAKIEKQNIDDLFNFISNKPRHTDELVFDCKKCGERHHYKKENLELEFEYVGGSERNMGEENQYQATEYFECDCGNEINVNFEVWEYPVGVHNYNDVGIDGAKLINCFEFSINFFGDDPDPDPNICEKCGDLFDDKLNIGICNKCEREYITK